MRKIWAIILTGMILSILSVSASAQEEKVDVVVTINILKDITENIGGQYVSVRSLVTGLENPHTYSTTPEDRLAIENSHLFVEIGMGLEPWVDDLTGDIPEERILVVSENCSKIGDNPHIWMSPENGKIIAEEIEKRLERIDPEHAGYYRRNLEDYLEVLNNTEVRIKQLGGLMEGKGIIAATPAFSYLLDFMGIEEVDTVVKGPGKEPGTKDIMRIEDEINSGKAQAILSMYQISMPVIEQISRDTGVPVITGTPLLGALGIDSYEQLLLYNANAIYSGLERADMEIKINSLKSEIDALKGEIGVLSIGIIAALILAVFEGYQIWKMRRGDW